MITVNRKPTKQPSHLKAAASIVARHQAEIERLDRSIVDHQSALDGNLTIAKRGHLMASLRFRQRDREKSIEVVALYSAVQTLDDYRAAAYALDEINTRWRSDASLVHYAMYKWMAEQYLATGSPGNAARCRKEMEHHRKNCLANGIDPEQETKNVEPTPHHDDQSYTY